MGDNMNTSITSCPLFPDNPHHCDVVIAVRRGTAAISLIGCLFMIAVIWLFKKYSAFAQRLILFLSIAALFDSISYLMGGLRPDGPMCDFQAWWLTFFDWCVLLWVSCITFNLFMNVVKNKVTDKYEWAYHVLCWVLSLSLSFLPFIGDHYGPAGAWCWIVEDWRWRLGIWYLPLFLIIFVLIVTYIYIIYYLSRKASAWQGTYDPDIERRKEMMKEDIKPLRAYPFVYFTVSIFPLINRIQNAIDTENHVFALVLLASLTAPLHGALNAIVFGLDRETFSRLTPSQIKVALMSHTQSPRVREYPVAYHRDSSSSSPPHDPSRYNNVGYTRLT